MLHILMFDLFKFKFYQNFVDLFNIKEVFEILFNKIELFGKLKSRVKNDLHYKMFDL